MLQRAKECSQALDLILDIDRGRPEKNVLDLEFDVEQMKVSLKKKKPFSPGLDFFIAHIFVCLTAVIQDTIW